jgi:1-acyl-sn-glycerol-3-phosphate acyltransferase
MKKPAMSGWIRLVAALPFAALAYALFLPLQVLSMKVAWLDENRFRCLLHKINAAVLGIRIHSVGAMTESRPVLIACNHVSWTDIPVLGSMMDASFVAKSEVRRWPVIGWLSTLQRCVYVDRERRGMAVEQADEIAGRLAAHNAIVLFAEGTTGDGTFMLPFKSTLFGAAARAVGEGGAQAVHVQPVAIAYTRLHGMPMGRQHRPLAAWIGDQDLGPHALSLLVEGGIDVEVHFGEPMAFAAGTSRKVVARQVEARVSAMLKAALADPLPSSKRSVSAVFCRRKALEAGQ